MLKTVAEGTAIAHPLRLREMIAALRDSGGSTVAVPEEDIVAALKKLAAQGLFVEPSCAHAAAALDELTRRGAIKANERTVVLLTGTGIKAAGYVAELFAQAA